MATDSPTQKTAVGDDRLTKWLGYITPVTTAVAGVYMYFQQQSSDTAFWLVSVLFVSILEVAGFVFWKKTVETSILVSANGTERFRIKRFPRWYRQSAWLAGVGLLVFAVVIRFGLRDQVFQLAKIDKAQGTRFYVKRDSPKCYPAPVFFLQDAKNYVYPGIQITLTNHGKGKLRIDSVKLLVEPVAPKVFSPIYGSPPTEDLVPNLYFARLSRSDRESEAQHYKDGEPSGGMVVIEENGFDNLNIMIDGELGLYRVKVQLTVQDQSASRSQLLTTDEFIYISPLRPRAGIQELDERGKQFELE